MKKFIYKTAFFFAFYIFLFGIVDFYITGIIKHSQVREYQIWEDIFNSRITADIVVFGSSRAYAHYNPQVFDSIMKTDFYNLGLNGKLADMDVFRYHQYKKHNNHQPKYILWDIMPTTFDHSDGYGDEQFMAYIWNRDVWNEIHNSRHGITYFDRIIPLLRYWRKNMIHSYPNAIMQVYKGYRKENTSFDSEELDQIENKSLRCNYNRDVINAFEKTIKEMQEDGATVVLVFSPLYKKGQYKYADLDTFLDTISNIAQRHNCHFLNYIDTPINNDTVLFKNATHLNSKGADVFSTILAHDLDSILNLQI